MMRYFGDSTRYPKRIFHWTPCKTELLAKTEKCVDIIGIKDYVDV